MDLSKEVSIEYIRRQIAGEQRINTSNSTPLQTQMWYTFDGNSKIKRKFIHFCFKHKEFIKKIPFLGKKAVKNKYKILSKLKAKIDTSPCIDMSNYINLPFREFILNAYRIMLGREPEQTAIFSMREMVYNGASNEVFVYIIATSKEFGVRARILHLQKYKKIYKRYLFKRRIKAIPILGRFIKLLCIPSQIATLTQSITYQNDILEYSINMANLKIDTLIHSYSQNMNTIIQKIDNQEDNIIEINDKIADFNNKDKVLDKILQNNNIIKMMNSNIKKISIDIENRLQFLSMNSVKNNKAQHILISDLYKKIDTIPEYISLGDTKIETLITNLHEKVDKEIFIGTDISQKVDIIPEYISLADTKIETLITNLHEKVDKEILIGTNISQKVDAIPEHISHDIKKSKTSFSGYPDGVIGIQIQNFIFGIPSEEWGLAAYLSLNEYFEYGSEKLFCSLLQSGMTVLDIGANLGIYSLHALRAGCEVYSFEPEPRIYSILQQNIKVNGFADLGHAHLFNEAVSDSVAIVDFYSCKKMCGHSNMFEAKFDTDVKITVNTNYIDNIISDNMSVDLVKIDVEGAEYNVLLGMKKTITKNPNIKILMEFAPVHIKRAGHNPSLIFDFIKELGFNIYSVNETNGKLYKTIKEELINCFSENILLTKERIEL